ncbi:Os01g0714175 [Oryza sativa Japonica Group]|uniref:Os01g0714175 protein n=1 Tax=Oryza sativa subsp. japonica TaxID=39947 RepID=A0A0P0V7A7_ORYSJ|nr:Os01g0714175 [Oryza sativa Japonica Group]
MSRDGAWGFVIRGENGRGVLAGSGRLPMVSDAHGRAEACLAALEAAIDHGISQVINESDCLNLVSALKTDEFDRSSGGTSFHPNLSSSGRECINRMNKNNPCHLLPLPKFQTLQYDPNIHPPNLLLREFHDFFHGFPLHHETRILSSSDPRSS